MSRDHTTELQPDDRARLHLKKRKKKKILRCLAWLLEERLGPGPCLLGTRTDFQRKGRNSDLSTAPSLPHLGPWPAGLEKASDVIPLLHCSTRPWVPSGQRFQWKHCCYCFSSFLYLVTSWDSQVACPISVS